MPLFKKLVVFLLIFALGAGVLVYFVWPREVPPVSEAPSSPLHVVIGRSVEGRAIDAYTFGQGATHLMFVGGIHGGYEWNSVLLAYQFIDYFSAHPEIVPANLSVTIIPNANPDGLFKIVGKVGRFTTADVRESTAGEGRFNANGVDLNRNFDCKWQPTSMWRGTPVSAGTSPFSEPESRAIRDFVLSHHPVAAIYWHSQANAVYASECEAGILPGTRTILEAYSTASGYPAIDSFDAYTVTGDTEGWLASIGIPALTVELSTHETVEWERNLSGVKAILLLYAR